MQTRPKNIAKRVQTKKATPRIFAKNYKQKIIHSNFAKKMQKKQQNTKEKNHNLSYYNQRLNPKKKLNKNSKKHHKRETKHLQTTLAVRCYRCNTSWKFPKNRFTSKLRVSYEYITLKNCFHEWHTLTKWVENTWRTCYYALYSFPVLIYDLMLDLKKKFLIKNMRIFIAEDWCFFNI